MDTDTEKQIMNDDDVFDTEDGLIFNPFNPGNLEINVNEIQTILRSHGINAKVHNINLYNILFNISHLVHNIKIDRSIYVYIYILMLYFMLLNISTMHNNT